MATSGVIQRLQQPSAQNTAQGPDDKLLRLNMAEKDSLTAPQNRETAGSRITKLKSPTKSKSSNCNSKYQTFKDLSERKEIFTSQNGQPASPVASLLIETTQPQSLFWSLEYDKQQELSLAEIDAVQARLVHSPPLSPTSQIDAQQQPFTGGIVINNANRDEQNLQSQTKLSIGLKRRTSLVERRVPADLVISDLDLQKSFSNSSDIGAESTKSNLRRQSHIRRSKDRQDRKRISINNPQPTISYDISDNLKIAAPLDQIDSLISHEDMSGISSLNEEASIHLISSNSADSVDGGFTLPSNGEEDGIKHEDAPKKPETQNIKSISLISSLRQRVSVMFHRRKTKDRAPCANNKDQAIFNIPVETLYEMSHHKLAFTARSLQQQVLISNMMLRMMASVQNLSIVNGPNQFSPSDSKENNIGRKIQSQHTAEGLINNINANGDDEQKIPQIALLAAVDPKKLMRDKPKKKSRRRRPLLQQIDAAKNKSARRRSWSSQTNAGDPGSLLYKIPSHDDIRQRTLTALQNDDDDDYIVEERRHKRDELGSDSGGSSEEEESNNQTRKQRDVGDSYDDDEKPLALVINK